MNSFNVKKPNFLIVGMAKCGTTSLAYYLNQHPDIYISKLKEPRFFTSQHNEIFPYNGPKDEPLNQRAVRNYEDYLSLFEGRTEKALGEASADTLYFYKYSIPIIKEKLGDPKIIIIIRNPVKRAFSAYTHLVRDEREPEPDFASAMMCESERIEKNWELIYHYKQVGLYYEPIKAFKENFSKVLVLINDDLKNDFQTVFNNCFEFLGVDISFMPSSDVQLNVSGKPRIRLLHDFLAKNNRFISWLRPGLRRIFKSRHQRQMINEWIKKMNLKRMMLKEKDKKLLVEYYRQDIKKTGELLGKDLSFWLR